MDTSAFRRVLQMGETFVIGLYNQAERNDSVIDANRYPENETNLCVQGEKLFERVSKLKDQPRIKLLK